MVCEVKLATYYKSINPYFAVISKPVKHGNPGIGATKSSAYVPLK
jgi:hypothetical protein